MSILPKTSPPVCSDDIFTGEKIWRHHGNGKANCQIAKADNPPSENEEMLHTNVHF
jgi:hypothetical protein